MPFLAAIPWLIPAIGAISGGVGIGSTIANDVSGGPSTPTAPPPASAATNVAAEVAKRQAEGAQVANQDPNIVANTNGSLSGLSDQTFSSQAAGLPGTFGQGGIDLNTIQQFLGGGGGSSNPTDLMQLASGSSGGSITA
jgi:hypothetical protein